MVRRGSSFGLARLPKNRPNTIKKLMVVFMVFLAIILSAVSFGTTLYGLSEFLAPKIAVKAPEGDVSGIVRYVATPDIVSRSLSIGTTIGIQGLMLVISFILGQQLISLRPMERPALPDIPKPAESSSRALNWRWIQDNTLKALSKPSGLWLALAYIFAVMAVWRYLAWPTPLIWIEYFLGDSTFAKAGEGGADNRFFFYTIVSIIGFWRSRQLGLGWTALMMSFLFFVYFGTMAFSSTFSFDAYYRFLRNEADLNIESNSIAREEAANLLSETGQLLIKTVSRQEQALRSSPDFGSLKTQLAFLNSRAEEYEDAVVADRNRARELLQREAQERRQLLAEAAGRAANADAKIAGLEAEKTRLDNSLQAMRDAIDAEEQKISAIEAALEPILDNRAEAKNRMDFEETGADGRPAGKKGKWRKAQKDFQKADKHIKKKEVDIKKVQAAVNQLQSRLSKVVTRIGAIPGLIIQQEFEKSGASATGPNEQTDGAAETSTEAVDISATSNVDQARVNFENNVNKQNFTALNGACNTLLGTMQRLIPSDSKISGFQCTPPALVLLTSELFRLQAGQTRFTQNCNEPALEKIRSGAVEVAFDTTRKCIQTTGLTGREISSLSNKLTQMISVYSATGHDIRRSFANLLRQEPYALGSAFAAVFIDALILVVGMIAAMLFQSPLLSNPRKLTAEEMQAMIKNILHLHNPGSSQAKTALRFIGFGEIDHKRFDFPLKIDRSKIKGEDKTLFNALVVMGRSFIKPDSSGEIYYMHSNLVQLLYAIAAEEDHSETDSRGRHGYATRPKKPSSGLDSIRSMFPMMRKPDDQKKEPDPEPEEQTQSAPSTRDPRPD